jgi:hypothetical protein
MARAEWRLDYPGSTQVSDFLASESVAYSLIDSRRSEWASGRSYIAVVVVQRRGNDDEWLPHEHIDFTDEGRSY